MTGAPKNIGVLASGRGTNLQAIIDAAASGRINGRVSAVVSDRRQAQALERARQAGIPSVFVSRQQSGSQEAFERQIAEALDGYCVDLVCLAGFMRILGPWFVERYRGRLLNIHPALLPAFPGLEAQRRALEYGVKISGCTVHFVDTGVDSGPIIYQAAVPVLDTDTVETLSERVLVEEHRGYIEAIRLFCDNRLVIKGQRVFIRDQQ